MSRVAKREKHNWRIDVLKGRGGAKLCVNRRKEIYLQHSHLVPTWANQNGVTVHKPFMRVMRVTSMRYSSETATSE